MNCKMFSLWFLKFHIQINIEIIMALILIHHVTEVQEVK